MFSPTQPLILWPIDYRTKTYDPLTQTTRYRGPFCQRWYKEQCPCAESCQDIDRAELVMLPGKTLRFLLHGMPSDSTPDKERNTPETKKNKAKRGRRKDYGDSRIFLPLLTAIIKAQWEDCLMSGVEPTVGSIVGSTKWLRKIARRTFEARCEEFRIDIHALIAQHKP